MSKTKNIQTTVSPQWAETISPRP